MALRSREKSGVHPATRVFQALRIAVNDELGVLAEAIPRAIGALRPGGRLAIITFHSLEDRVVKRAFLEAAGRAPVPPGLALLEENAAAAPLVRIVTRKPVAPQPAEVKSNPRSRSAKLRVVEKLDS